MRSARRRVARRINAAAPAAGGCPSSCAETTDYECVDVSRLRRVTIYDCGTHQGCRVHDDCLDACIQRGGRNSGDCQKQCDADIMERYGIDNAGMWLMGNGPYDGRIKFEYTVREPGAIEAAYRCPAGAARQCGGMVGCKTADGAWVEPIFDAYPGAGGMQISAFPHRAGLRRQCLRAECRHQNHRQ